MKNTQRKQKKVIPNKFHLHIQTKYRTLIQEDKTKYKRSRSKAHLIKELKAY